MIGYVASKAGSQQTAGLEFSLDRKAMERRGRIRALRRSGWVTYDPLRADFRYPDVRTMFDHHYRHKLIFRFYIADDTETVA